MRTGNATFSRAWPLAASFLQHIRCVVLATARGVYSNNARRMLTIARAINFSNSDASKSALTANILIIRRRALQLLVPPSVQILFSVVTFRVACRGIKRFVPATVPVGAYLNRRLPLNFIGRDSSRMPICRGWSPISVKNQPASLSFEISMCLAVLVHASVLWYSIQKQVSGLTRPRYTFDCPARI